MLGRYITRAVDAQSRWSKPFGDFNHRWLGALFHPIRPIQNFLNGTWLGHPVHSVVTDVPIGALTVSIVADIIGQHVVADVSMLLGVLAMVAAAVTGLADYAEVDGTAAQPRDRPRDADGHHARRSTWSRSSSGAATRRTGSFRSSWRSRDTACSRWRRRSAATSCTWSART